MTTKTFKDKDLKIYFRGSIVSLKTSMISLDRVRVETNREDKIYKLKLY